MNQPILSPKSFCQVALVVRDIDQSRRAYAKIFGCEPPPVRETGGADETHIRYRGQPTTARAKLAFLPMGQASLELIEPIGAPSIWQEFLDRNGDSLHHVAYRVPDMKQATDALAANGCPTVQTGDFKGGCYAYVDATKSLGVLLELLASTHAK